MTNLAVDGRRDVEPDEVSHNRSEREPAAANVDLHNHKNTESLFERASRDEIAYPYRPSRLPWTRDKAPFVIESGEELPSMWNRTS